MTRTFALVIGLLFLVLGILGFVPSLTTEGGEYLFGIFAVDAVHNLVYLLVGALGVAAYYWDRARLYCQVLGGFMLLIGIMGLIPALVFEEKLLGIFAVNLADNVLHLVVGAGAAYLGFATQFTGRRISPTH
ncbi:MAG TPA: DUF4383 domain-containing protein [Rubrobacter sp.]